jgi:hypothetical protein
VAERHGHRLFQLLDGPELERAAPRFAAGMVDTRHTLLADPGQNLALIAKGGHIVKNRPAGRS